MSRKERLEAMGDRARNFTNVYLKNFGDDLTDDKLMDIVSPFGNVISAKVSPSARLSVLLSPPSILHFTLPLSVCNVVPCVLNAWSHRWEIDGHRQSVRKCYQRQGTSVRPWVYPTFPSLFFFLSLLPLFFISPSPSPSVMSYHDLTDEKLMDIVSPFGNVISAKVSPFVRESVCLSVRLSVLLSLPSSPFLSPPPSILPSPLPLSLCNVVPRSHKLMDIVSPFGNVISAKVSPSVCLSILETICPTFHCLAPLSTPSLCPSHIVEPWSYRWQVDGYRQSVRKCNQRQGTFMCSFVCPTFLPVSYIYNFCLPPYCRIFSYRCVDCERYTYTYIHIWKQIAVDFIYF